MRCVCLALALMLAATALTDRVVALPTAGEVRGMWVVRTSLTSPASVQRTVQDARSHGFNTLLVQVRGRGDAYFEGGSEPRAAALASQPASFDPLAEILRAGHAAGLRVHAWVSVNLVASAVTLPSSREHIVHRHPEWLMVPRDLASELHRVSPRDPSYVQQLARWTRGQLADVEGLYASPVHPAASSHVVSLIGDLVRRYPVDGVHLDYVRYPRDDFDYSTASLGEFRASLVGDLAPGERQRLDARAVEDPTAYADLFPARWAAFHRSRLTSLVMRARTTARTTRPDLLFSAAVAPDPTEAAVTRLQDWTLWAQNGLIDAVCPMAYTVDTAQFARQVADVTRAVGPGAVWAGIGVFKLAPAQALEQIQAARRAGAAGFLLFSYDSMTEPGQPAPDYLKRVGRAALDEPMPEGPSR